jgi:hypothetical protein
MESEGRGGMKCDSIPHNLHLLCRDTAILQKRPGRVGAIYLEAILCRVAVGQTQIVQNRSYRMSVDAPGSLGGL